MISFCKAVTELCLRSISILKKYGLLRFIKRAWKYFKKQGWRSVLSAGDINSQYQKWLAKKLPERKDSGVTEYADIQLISILIPVYNPRLEHLHEAVDSILNQDSPKWQLCLADDCSKESWVVDFMQKLVEQDERITYVCHSSNKGISEATNSALSIAKSEYVLFMDQDDILWTHTISSFQKVLNEDTHYDIIYGGEDKFDEHIKRHSDPYFKPEWSPHLLYSYNYVGHPLVVRKKLVEQVGGFRKELDGSQDHDLLLRLSELKVRVRRIPDILYSWRITVGSTSDGWDAKPEASRAGCFAIEESLSRRGYLSKASHSSETGIYHCRINLKKHDKVSVIIPSKDNGQILKRCLDSIHSKSTYKNYEIIIIDNGSTEKNTTNFLDLIRSRNDIKILSYPEPFNYPVINNLGAAHASGQHFVFLNDDTEVITSDWLEALLEHSQMANVGAVGALLIFPNRLIQHAGIVVGMRGSASHAFYKCDSRAPGYFNLAHSIRNVSAVTAACLMVKADTFSKVGGFNPSFRVGLNDVDFCLRLLKMGLYNVYTPHAKLIHYESLSRGEYVDEEEIKLFNQTYQNFIDNGDPYYNPELSLERNDYSLVV